MLAIANSRAVGDLISLPEAIDLVALAMKELSSGLVDAPERSLLPVSPRGRLVLMPGSNRRIERFGVKLLSLVDNSSERGLPSHQGVMVLFDSESGRPLCIIDCDAVTTLRTAAATAVATRALARPEASELAILGCGSLAALHVEAMLQVRPVGNVRVWSRSADKARTFARTAAARLGVSIEAVAGVEEAIEGADIICTLTGSSLPVLEGRWLTPGQHLNLVGASTRASREIDDEAVARGYYIVDSRAHALEQAGELRHAMEAGLVDAGHIAGEIGQVLNETKPGRADASTITIYKSLGHATQDLRVADALFSRLNRSKDVAWVPWPD